ncbi:MAG: hypothetical protein LIP06_06440 [Tannerellaceae bacterium]|nr:hypothetical protein [Tannerellaceae bacterium]
MKKSILYLFMVAVACIACEPIEDRQSAGGAITADQLDISATPVVVDGKNSNRIILENKSPVLSQWDYGNGLSTRAYDEVDVVVMGDLIVTFTGLNADGTKITKELPIRVDELSFEVPAAWGYLCGNSSKEWSWDTTQPTDTEDGTPNVWGNGEYKSHMAPAWWKPGLSSIDSQATGEGEGAYMVFSLSGAKLTKYKNDGTVEEGSFSFDMNETTEGNDGSIWGIGKLSTTNLLIGRGAAEYDILILDDEQLVLAEDVGEGVAYFWMFRAR